MNETTEPLLVRQSTLNHEQDGEKSPADSAAVNLLFAKRIWRLMRIAQCGDCFLLIVLSVCEVGILSQAGLVVGQFYNALISKNSRLFLQTIGQYVLWYSAETICSAGQVWISELLALRWRRKLTQAAHRAYCSGSSLRRLSQHFGIDNPDERITNEINYLCQNLAQILLKTIAAPLMILYYTWWVGYHVGWFGPVVIYIFFAAGATLMRWIISPIARLVARQEKLEAFFRIFHVWFRTNAEAIAMSDSANYEMERLEEYLQDALLNKKKLVSRHFLLAINTKAYDYLGGGLNYCVLAIPVFGGMFDSDDSGQLANLISNASFAVLQLIYSFTQVMDTAKLVSDLAGYTARTSELFEVLEILPQGKDSNGAPSLQDDSCPTFEVFSPTEKRSLGVRQESYLVCPPTCWSLEKGTVVELSIHFAPSSLHEGLGRTFPDIAPASLLIVPVFQTSTAGDKRNDNLQDIGWHSVIQSVQDNQLSDGCYFSTPVTDGASAHTESFRELILHIKEELRNLGHWTDAGDPLLQGKDTEQEPGPSSTTGIQSVSAEESHRYNQVDAVKLLLGYSSTSVGSVSTVAHPRFGCNYTISTVYTTAPVKVLQSVLVNYLKVVATECQVDSTPSGSELPQVMEIPSAETICISNLLPALVVDHITCHIPGSLMPIVQDLTLQLLWGQSLLVMGATGSGKTSLLRALCGLWPLHSGKIRIPPMFGGKGVLMLPQRPLMARAGLAGQIMYPEKSPSQKKLSSLKILCLRNTLEAVGMLHLLEHLDDDWEIEKDWSETLSPGEQQSLALARVLYHQPQLVILDEATSALSEDAEDAIYKQIMGLGISVISVAHRSRLIRHHTNLLVMLGDEKGGWSLS